MAQPWCLSFLDRKLHQSVIDDKIQTLYDWSRESFPEDGCFTFPWLDDLIHKIDVLWYDGKLIKSLNKAYGGVHLCMDLPETRVAGYVIESPDRKKISLHLNRDLFVMLFKDSKKKRIAYHSGGLLCEDRFMCLLHVLLHEIVHLLFTLCEKQGHRDDIDPHGPEFRQVVANLYGQTDSQHGLVPGLHQKYDLDTIKSKIKVKHHVWVQAETGLVPGVVVKKGTKWIHVKNLQTGQTLPIHAGLIRFPEDCASNHVLGPPHLKKKKKGHKKG